ncbi:MAG TPA: DUF4145 domain-containing protein [Anaerolineae bacterium]|nr:DUF4145 domain-containing protein [Anaerolineae bacterium]
MKCPHCGVEFHPRARVISLGSDVEGEWAIQRYVCPNGACSKSILYLVKGVIHQGAGAPDRVAEVHEKRLINPTCSGRPPAPLEVPRVIAEDYAEACIVLPYSAKASAALSRRCLQHLLRDEAHVKPNTLSAEIKELLDAGELPSYIANAVDAVRNVGNFAAHPIKSERTGEIVRVEPGEAEWNLDVLEALFDFYFVGPEVLKKKQEALDAKLREAGMPPMKKSAPPSQ